MAGASSTTNCVQANRPDVTRHMIARPGNAVHLRSLGAGLCMPAVRCKDPSLWQLRSGQSNPAGYDSCMLLLCHLMFYLGTIDALRMTSSKFV